MANNNSDIKDKLLKHLCEHGSSQLSSGLEVKIIKKPIATHGFHNYADGNIYLLEKLLEDLINEDFVEEVSATKESRNWQITTQGANFYINEGGYTSLKKEQEVYGTEEEIHKIRLALDDLIIRIKRLELGQQIIYDDLEDDIEELKKIIGEISKKSILNQLKGILINHGLGDLKDEVIKIISQVFKDQHLLN